MRVHIFLLLLIIQNTSRVLILLDQPTNTQCGITQFSSHKVIESPLHTKQHLPQHLSDTQQHSDGPGMMMMVVIRKGVMCILALDKS